MINLAALSNQYRQREDRLTDKQLAYLRTLLQTFQRQNEFSNRSDPDHPSDHPQEELTLKQLGKEQLGHEPDEEALKLELVEKFLNREVPSFDCLNKDDMALLVRQLTEEIKISPMQAMLLQQTMTLRKISERLKKEVGNYLELSIRDFRFLMKAPSRFYLIPLDRPIITNSDWEYCYQYSDLCAHKKMYYIKFYQMLILDYDTQDYDQLLNRLKPYLTEACFAIYKTHAGFHVHLLSKPMPHEEDDTYQVMKSFECDPFYALFSHKFGFKVRLSKKINRVESFLLKFINLVGNPHLLDPYLHQMLSIHDFYVKQHSD